MPVFSITDGHGSLLPGAPGFVFSRMLFPRDEDLFVCHMAWTFVFLGLFSEDEAVEVPRSILEILVEAPSADAMAQLGMSAMMPAIQVGQLLTFILSCKAAHPQHTPSISKAWDVFSQHYKGKMATDGETPISASVAYLKREWTRYKPVAHLWAAHCALHDVNDSPLPVTLVAPDSAERLLDLLGLAETLRRESEAIYAQGQRLPILNPAETWTCPPDLELPSIEPEYQPLPPEMLALLERRRARRPR